MYPVVDVYIRLLITRSVPCSHAICVVVSHKDDVQRFMTTASIFSCVCNDENDRVMTLLTALEAMSHVQYALFA